MIGSVQPVKEHLRVGLFPFRTTKLGIKKPMKDESSIGVKFMGVVRKVAPFYGNCPPFSGEFMGVERVFYGS